MAYAFQVQILYLVVVALALRETQQSYRYSCMIKSLLLFFVKYEHNSLHGFLFIYSFIYYYYYYYYLFFFLSMNR